MADAKEKIVNTSGHFARRAFSDQGRMATFLREVQRVLLDQAPFRAYSRALVVQCGDGWAAEEAWRRLARGYVCGLDVSSGMTRRAYQLRGVPGELEFKAWNGRNAPFPDVSFEIVLSVFGFHRYPDPSLVLREMWRVLRPGGHIYLLEPDRKSFWGLYALFDYYCRLTDPAHTRYYASTDLLRLIREAGFVDVKELARYERLLVAGKLMASATVLHGRREDRDTRTQS